MHHVSAGFFLIPKLSEEETEENQQGPSGSQPSNDKGSEGDDEEEKPMDQDLSAKEVEDKELAVKASSLDFAVLDELEQTDIVADTTEGASTLELPLAFLVMSQQSRVQGC